MHVCQTAVVLCLWYCKAQSHWTDTLIRWIGSENVLLFVCFVVLFTGIKFPALGVQCGNRSLGSNSIHREGKFRLWPCHLNCYFVVKLLRSWLVLIAMPGRASASVPYESWPALPCRQLWLQLPWPMCRRTVSLWIIHALCSSLTQEHWRQPWIMFTLILLLKY